MLEEIQKETKQELRRELWHLREGLLKDLPSAVAVRLSGEVERMAAHQKQISAPSNRLASDLQSQSMAMAAL